MQKITSRPLRRPRIIYSACCEEYTKITESCSALPAEIDEERASAGQ